MSTPLDAPIATFIDVPGMKRWSADMGRKLAAVGFKTAKDVLVLDQSEPLTTRGIAEQEANDVMHHVAKKFVDLYDDANDFEEYTVTFTKSPLGLTFICFKNEEQPGSGDLVAVSSFSRDANNPSTPSQAEATGKIKILDQLVSANGIPLVNASFEEAMQTLQGCAFPYTVNFRRPVYNAPEANGGAAKKDDPNKVQMSGWLEKQGHVRKAWQKRWFVLQNRTLTYYTDDPSKGGKEKGKINLEGSTIYSLEDKENPHCFAVQESTGGKVKAFPIKASAEAMRECWVDLIKLHGTDAAMAGYVTKKGGFNTWSYKQRWMVLEGSTLYYFTSPSGELKGTIELTGAKIQREKDKTKFSIEKSERTYEMQVTSERERNTWVTKCQEAIGGAGSGGSSVDSSAVDRDYDLLSETSMSSGNSVAEKVASPSGTTTSSRRSSAKDRVETSVNTFSVSPDGPVSLKDFKLMKVVGRGAFGKVMLAQKTTGEQAGKVFAIKVLIKSDVVAKKQVENTIAERNILMQMRHPYIVCLRYSFENRDKLYLVTDYYNGGAMFYHVRKSRGFDEARTRFYAAELMLAIDHLHQHGIIYRDMKLENILMDHRGHIALTDFGLSKQNLSEVFAEEQNTFCGTAEYIAPELIRGVPYSAAVDWWSYGILVYEMKNLKTPFYDKNRKVRFHDLPSDSIEPRNLLTASLFLFSPLVAFPDYVARDYQHESHLPRRVLHSDAGFCEEVTQQGSTRAPWMHSGRRRQGNNGAPMVRISEFQCAYELKSSRAPFQTRR